MRAQFASLALLLLPLSVAAAVPPSTPGEPKQAPGADPKVCENVTVTGSRLAVRRFCGTKSQWDDKRRQDRDMVDQIQRSPCVLTHTGGNGHPAC